MGELIGYCRVSSRSQDYQTQKDRLSAAGAIKLFEEKKSGLDDNRPELARCLEYVREGDTLIVTKLDRLARSASHLHQIVDKLNKDGAGFKVLDDASLDTTTRTGNPCCTGRGAPFISNATTTSGESASAIGSPRA